MTFLRGNIMRNKWNNLFTLMDEASKHPNRSSFAKHKRNAYNAAKQAGLLDALFPVVVWTQEKTIQEAKKFRSRSAFRKASPGAFAAMERNGLLDVYFARWQEEDKPIREAAARPLLASTIVWK